MCLGPQNLGCQLLTRFAPNIRFLPCKTISKIAHTIVHAFYRVLGLVHRNLCLGDFIIGIGKAHSRRTPHRRITKINQIRKCHIQIAMIFIRIYQIFIDINSTVFNIQFLIFIVALWSNQFQIDIINILQQIVPAPRSVRPHNQQNIRFIFINSFINNKRQFPFVIIPRTQYIARDIIFHWTQILKHCFLSWHF